MDKSLTRKRKSFNKENTNKENSTQSPLKSKLSKLAENPLVNIDNANKENNLIQSPLKSNLINVKSAKSLIDKDTINFLKESGKSLKIYDIEKDLKETNELVELRNIKEMLAEVGSSRMNEIF